MNNRTDNTAVLWKLMSGLAILALLVGVMAGCADIQDDERVVGEEEDDDLVLVNGAEVTNDCVGPCFGDDDDFTYDLFADFDMPDMEYDFPDDGSDDSGDDGSDGSGDDGTDDSGDDGSGDDGGGDDGSDDVGFCDFDASGSICPSSQGYWSNHTDNWPISVPDDCSNSSDVGCLCGMSYEDILNSPTTGDTWMILAQQWVAAVLNADIDACDATSEEYLVVGEALLDSCAIAEDDEEAALELAGRLDLFNNGEMSSGCSD